MTTTEEEQQQDKTVEEIEEEAKEFWYVEHDTSNNTTNNKSQKDKNDLTISFYENRGNSFHLAAVVRKYCNARQKPSSGRLMDTKCQVGILYDALGLFRSLQYDVMQWNQAVLLLRASTTANNDDDESKSRLFSKDDLKYACHRLSKQASAFGVSLPRLGDIHKKNDNNNNNNNNKATAAAAADSEETKVEEDSSSSFLVEVKGLDLLVSYLEASHSFELQTAQSLLETGGVVDFPSLAEFYKPGTDLLDRGVVTGAFGVPLAVRVRACFFSRGKSLFGTVSTFYVAVEFVVSTGQSGNFAVVECHHPISEFAGTVSVRDGTDHYIALTPNIRQELIERGKLYQSITSSSHAYVQYAPGTFLPSHRGGRSGASSFVTRSRGSGRIMIDTRSAYIRGIHCARAGGEASDAVISVLKLCAQKFARAAAAAASSSSSSSNNDASSEYSVGTRMSGGGADISGDSLDVLLLKSPLPDPLLHRTWPMLPGFSFDVKSWGVVMVHGISNISFNERAFDQLVIPPNRKRLIQSLVLSHGSSSKSSNNAATTKTKTDLIEGKGEGSIFLLHGPPGVGKTLTAEAIAEMLHKPLYIVSMGELGTSPETLEDRLRDALDLCVPWNALVLIDEAEMLLERRTKEDIVRNAMVCVMLRLLEYYSGILFLTTNRVQSLDPAFQSRVHCALKYEALDEEARVQVWINLLNHATEQTMNDDDDGIDVKELAKTPLNGRQIKNTLQLALALCKTDDVPLAQHHIEETMQLTNAFARDLLPEEENEEERRRKEMTNNEVALNNYSHLLLAERPAKLEEEEQDEKYSGYANCLTATVGCCLGMFCCYWDWAKK